MPQRKVVKKHRGLGKLRADVFGMLLMITACYSLLSLYRPDLTGQAGKLVSYSLSLFFGNNGAVLVALGSFFVGLHLTLQLPRRRRASWSMVVLVLSLLVAMHLSIPAIQRDIRELTDGTGAGIVGGLLGRSLLRLFGVIGAWTIVWCAGLLAVLGATGLTLRGAFKALCKLAGQAYQVFRVRLQREKSALVPKVEIDEQPVNLPLHVEEKLAPPERISQEAVISLPAPKAEEPPAVQQVEQLKLPQSEYSLPGLLLLNRGLRQGSARGSREEKENIRILEETLANFGVKAKVVDVTRGPTCTRYEIQMAPGTKVSKVTGLSNDLAMSLASEGVRIEAPIPGKAAIGIEVPNKARGSVLLRDCLEGSEFSSSTSPLTVALGKDIEGNTVIADLSQMPHLLIAGATGAGKSVCINTLVCSVLYKSRPDEVKMMLVDPKVVELSTYNGIPHLIAPVLNHPKKAAAALKWATGEMEKRYAAFARAGVRDIERYNERAMEKGLEKMPFILIVIDELADLMMVARADVEDAICRLAQMARAAGMHLVIGTQRPSTDVITGLIKANIPSRLSFTVSSATDSRVILDMTGAEKLLGKGDMLFLPVGLSKAKRIQGAFVSNREIERIVDFVSSQGEAVYVDALNRLEEIDNTANESDGELDDRFDDAVRIVVETGQASVSMLQRRMRLGYTRAARIVDQMQEAGIVGPGDGSKPRQINKNHPLVKTILENGKRTGD